MAVLRVYNCSRDLPPTPLPNSNPSNPPRPPPRLPPTLSIAAPISQPSLSTRHTTLLVDAFHHNQSLRALLSKLEAGGSDPVRILEDDGDWSRHSFWAVVKYLAETSRIDELKQVFDHWRNIEKSRINEANYAKIVDILCTAGCIDEAGSAFSEMIGYGLNPLVETYNCIIHGLAKRGKFDEAKLYISMMVEKGVLPDSETYDCLIQAYGNFRLYDEMCRCVKKMETQGCSADYVTYNILIRAFARGGLLDKMEGMYQCLLSKKMSLQASTLTVMLEAYGDYNCVEKMEKFYRRIITSKVHIKESLIRKVAKVYMDNYKFSALEQLGIETASRTGRTNLVWYLLLLSHSCLLSQKGIMSVIREMEMVSFDLDVSCMNIVALAYLKMKDSRKLHTWLSRFQFSHIQPDIVTVGIAYDACLSNLCQTKLFVVWQRAGLLSEEAKLATDSLVLTAFGKGFFLRSCEDLYSKLDPKLREKKLWTYQNLIGLVSHGRKLDYRQLRNS